MQLFQVVCLKTHFKLFNCTEKHDSTYGWCLHNLEITFLINWLFFSLKISQIRETKPIYYDYAYGELMKETRSSYLVRMIPFLVPPWCTSSLPHTYTRSQTAQALGWRTPHTLGISRTWSSPRIAKSCPPERSNFYFWTQYGTPLLSNECLEDNTSGTWSKTMIK